MLDRGHSAWGVQMILVKAISAPPYQSQMHYNIVYSERWEAIHYMGPSAFTSLKEQYLVHIIYCIL